MLLIYFYILVSSEPKTLISLNKAKFSSITNTLNKTNSVNNTISGFNYINNLNTINTVNTTNIGNNCLESTKNKTSTSFLNSNNKYQNCYKFNNLSNYKNNVNINNDSKKAIFHKHKSTKHTTRKLTNPIIPEYKYSSNICGNIKSILNNNNNNNSNNEIPSNKNSCKIIQINNLANTNVLSTNTNNNNKHSTNSVFLRDAKFLQSSNKNHLDNLNYKDLSYNSLNDSNNKEPNEEFLNSKNAELNANYYKKYKQLLDKLSNMKDNMKINNVLNRKDIDTVIESRRVTLIEMLKNKYMMDKTVLNHKREYLKIKEKHDNTENDCLFKYKKNKDIELTNNRDTYHVNDYEEDNISNSNVMFNLNNVNEINENEGRCYKNTKDIYIDGYNENDNEKSCKNISNVSETETYNNNTNTHAYAYSSVNYFKKANQTTSKFPTSNYSNFNNNKTNSDFNNAKSNLNNAFIKKEERVRKETNMHVAKKNNNVLNQKLRNAIHKMEELSGNIKKF